MERRGFLEKPTVDKESRKVVGYAIVFNRESKILYDKKANSFFVEVIKPSAVTTELINSSDVKGLINHNKERMVARSYMGSGSLTLTIDDYGLRYEFEAPRTVDGDYLLEAIERGDIFGSSFAFFADEKFITYDKNEEGIKRRTINIISGLYDISPCNDPAYFGTYLYHERSVEEGGATFSDKWDNNDEGKEKKSERPNFNACMNRLRSI